MSYSRDFLLSLSHNTNPPSRQLKRQVFYLNVRSNNSNKLNKNILNYSKSFKNNCKSSQIKKKKNLKKSGRKKGHPSRKIATKTMKVLFKSDL